MRFWADCCSVREIGLLVPGVLGESHAGGVSKWRGVAAAAGGLVFVGLLHWLVWAHWLPTAGMVSLYRSVVPSPTLVVFALNRGSSLYLVKRRVRFVGFLLRRSTPKKSSHVRPL